MNLLNILKFLSLLLTCCFRNLIQSCFCMCILVTAENYIYILKNIFKKHRQKSNMEIVETEANIDTLNWYIHDLSLSRLTYTWPLTLHTMSVWRVRGHVYVSLESEWSCICQSGEWEVMYMSVWRVRGHLYVSLERERLCICQYIVG
jgi:hypothetical protein